MKAFILQSQPSPDDDVWQFNVPSEHLRVPQHAGNRVRGKMIRFTGQEITLEIAALPNNRILHDDDVSQFILLSFGGLRFQDSTLRATGEYISRFLKTGLFINGIQYRFYHHSNSQLRGRSCFLRQAKSDAELDDRIYRLGDFGKIMNVAKRAKRIGLLFSEAQIDYRLDPRYIADIPDIKSGDEVFSDGCGLISKNLAVQLSRSKKIIFRGVRYTPGVFQIRYLGYKGVLSLHPEMDGEKQHLAQFRKSMKKFTATGNTTFSVVDYAKPYAFGRLNNDIVVLLSSLGVTDEKLLNKQKEYFTWIEKASEDPIKAVDFLSCLEHYQWAERVLLDGIDDAEVSRKIRSQQLQETASFRNERGKNRSRMIIHKSRLLFGICDPSQVLKEGEVHIRITAGGRGASTPVHGDVLVVRNPCLHPGDCLKLRAVHNAKLSHLVDCIVFAGVARPGHQPAPAMTSGGDLDGDKFFVCWDPDLVPATVVQSYDYPPNKEHVSRQVTRADLAHHFASYNNAGLARVAALHAKWVRSSPKGALSPECQELNALHSQSVDGAGIKIPERLTLPPESKEPYIIDLLGEAASVFATEFARNETSRVALRETEPNAGKELLTQLLQSEQNAMSEYELFNLALALSRKHGFDLRPFLVHLDFGALTAAQKHAISQVYSLDPNQSPSKALMPYAWNSLLRSDILSAEQLYQRNLNHPFSLQRLYSSKINGLATFFEYLRMATQDFTRKLLVLKTDDRFSVSIFMRGTIPWQEEPEVNENVVCCCFLPRTSDNFSPYKPCTSGYRLHCSDTSFQLYNKNRGNTFVFLSRLPGIEVGASIALQNFSQRVQKQLGRVYRMPVTAIELHVLSNRDRIAHQLFDLWFEHVPTETYIKRFERQVMPYRMNALEELTDDDWNQHPNWLKIAFVPKQYETGMQDHLSTLTHLQLDKIMEFGLKYHAEDEVFWTFGVIISQRPIRRDTVIQWMDGFPPLAFSLLKVYPPDNSGALPQETAALAHPILRNLVRSANDLRIAVLVAFEKLGKTIADLALNNYFDLLMLTAWSVRSQELVQEVLFVLNDCRIASENHSEGFRYGHKHALAIAFDRAEEAADECPCNDEGKPRKQRTPPVQTKLKFLDDSMHVQAAIRIDAKSPVRLHSHVRLQAASKAENRWVESPIMDGVVIQSLKGEMKIELMHPPPPEMEAMDWNMYNAGSIATSKAMIDALLRLLQDREGSCLFYSIITGDAPEDATVFSVPASSSSAEIPASNKLNPSQLTAIRSCEVPLSLIWGPPGTGKTTVVVQILRRILQSSSNTTKILMTASTHNAVDNVLERFVELNKSENVLREEQILRVATDLSKVNKDLQEYTIDARVGGDMNENNRLFKKAQERLKTAVLVFTTCAGAGLGILRKVDFEIALIDEASQITEPVAIIPLCKGVRRAILVGDHVQLRPTVKKVGKALQFDVSLLERLYTGTEDQRIAKTMLDVQYRFPKELAEFPSREFYENRLQTGLQDSARVLSILARCTFPWPRREGVIVPTVFIQCGTEEDMGGMSKSNEGQVDVVGRIAPMLAINEESREPLKVTVLSPYSKQVQTLRHRFSGSSALEAFTIDSFQGRESDIIIFSTVRCNAERDIGFVDDERRLNVMWTRAKLALIIIGDRPTMTANALWKRALDSCREVVLPAPESVNAT